MSECVSGVPAFRGAKILLFHQSTKIHFYPLVVFIVFLCKNKVHTLLFLAKD